MAHISNLSHFLFLLNKCPRFLQPVFGFKIHLYTNVPQFYSFIPDFSLSIKVDYLTASPLYVENGKLKFKGVQNRILNFLPLSNLFPIFPVGLPVEAIM